MNFKEFLIEDQGRIRVVKQLTRRQAERDYPEEFKEIDKNDLTPLTLFGLVTSAGMVDRIDDEINFFGYWKRGKLQDATVYEPDTGMWCGLKDLVGRSDE